MSVDIRIKKIIFTKGLGYMGYNSGCSDNKYLKIDGYYAVEPRGCNEIQYILKVRKLGKNIPQQIYGRVLDLLTGDIKEIKDVDIFAFQVGQEIIPEQLDKIKDFFIERLRYF